MRSPLLRNIVRTFSTQIGTQLFSIVTGIVVARSIGPAGKGFVSYAGMAVTLVSTLLLGFSDAVMYQLARERIAGRAVYRAALRILVASLAVVVPVLAVVGVLVPSQRALLVAALALPAALYVQFATPFLLVAERIGFTNMRLLTQSFGTAVVTIPLLLWSRFGLRAVLATWLCFGALSALQTAWALRPILRSAETQSVPGVLAGQLAFGLRAGGASVAGYINLRIDVFVVSTLLSAAALGWYTLAIASGELLWLVSRAILWPALGRIASDPPHEAALLVARMTRNTLAIVGTFGAIAFICGPWLIVHVYGRAFEPAGLALRVALPGLVAYAAETALTHYVMLQLARPLALTWIQSLSSAVCAALAIATVGRFGIVAAAASTSVTYLIVTVILIRMFTRSTGLSVIELLLIRAEDIARYRAAIAAALRTLRLRADAR